MPHSEIPWEKIAVFDVNHGGLSIAKQLAKHGIAATAFDVYQKMPPEKMKEFADESNISVTADVSDLTEDFDIVCLPVHLNPDNEFYKKAIELGLPTVSHHEIAGRLLRSDPRIADRYLVEITGVRGKTSTAVLLAQMLSYKNRVLLHTSEGMTFWDSGSFERIEPGISITPAYIPDLADIAFERKYTPDTLIFEVSLGFTGAQDIGILTEAQPDYMIAGGALTSTDAKTKMISRSKEGSIFVINYDDLETIENYIREDQDLVVFDDYGTAVEEKTPTDVYVNITTGTDEEPVADVESSRTGIFFRAPLSPGYDVNSYRTAMAAAVAAALELDVPESQIIEVISGFEGVKGRMREYEENGRQILDNSNSGLTIETAETAIKYMLEKYTDKKSPEYDSSLSRDVILIIGEEEKTVCEGLEPHDVEELIVNYKDEIQNLILVGERMKPLQKNNADQEEALEQTEDEIFNKAICAGSFKEGLQKAVEISKEGDIIIAAVKCFR
ncbi:coenzyme F430 synthase [Methanimicrococcus blatticola]|uniref:UDP-N-acetylmuramyl pentapeptide synthase n=1 Tax=Methanimicrococcus blatticola TaxID=91560 RepID=A0A484F7E4_9EURY|nr:coenzyme F430 synthase [Methanimicrococcus blatticola]MBZ3935241.1 coenzyme F430 synthase [Methanimicrococcus blatticola]MCC2508661.1 coenzyme F430 synthase [Methanimicrococcus blatticola]TDQ71302.1 UDP-N-acetylmuramyl pentapeptide synthase [Methanimicrococcus blatticola]